MIAWQSCEMAVEMVKSRQTTHIQLFPPFGPKEARCEMQAALVMTLHTNKGAAHMNTVL
jgi:hypothetical protein